MVKHAAMDWDTDTIDCPSASVATKILDLHGGESVIITSLATGTNYHFIGKKSRCELSRGYKLRGTASVSLTLPLEFGRENYVEVYAMPASAGDDVTYAKLIDIEPFAEPG